MPQLPVMSGREVVRAFEKRGWHVARQRGSHIILVKEGAVPRFQFLITKKSHGGTLRSLIRAAGITIEEFI